MVFLCLIAGKLPNSNFRNEGYHKHGKLQGRGKMTMCDSKVYEGRFENDKFVELYSCTLANGTEGTATLLDNGNVKCE